jgi:hypothetical protein
VTAIIDPPHEAVQLAEHYREAARLDDGGTEFVRLLSDGECAARDLEQALRANPVDAGRAARAFARSSATFTACHERFRDRPGGR